MQPDYFEPPGRGGFQPHRVAEVPQLPDSEESLDLRKYLNALRRRWPLALACVVIAATYALVQYTLTTKEYLSSTTIQIERKRLSLAALGQAAWLEDFWNMKYYPTQYRLLRSRGMAERVVQNLRLYQNPAFTGRPAEPTSSEEGVETSSSSELAQMAARVMGGLEVAPIKETELVVLSYRSTSPELAAQLADGYAQAFIEWGIETRSTTVGQASTLLSDQIATLNQEIEERRKLLNSLAADGDFALDPEGEALLERQQSLETKYNSVVAERIGKEAAYNGIVSVPKETVANTSSGGRVRELKSEIFLLESEYKSKLSTYLPNWPDMERLKKDIEDQRGQLQRLIAESYNQTKDQAFAEYQKALREERSLEEELRKLVADARLQNSAALEYSNHKTFIKTRVELRDNLLKRLSETEIASRTQGFQESNVRVVDSAIVPKQPFKPSLRKDLSQAILIGLFLGIGSIVLLEVLDRTIKSPEELEAIVGFPTLAVVPDIDERRRSKGLRRYGKNSYGYGYGYGYSYGYGYGYGYGRSAKSRGGKRPKKGKGAGDGEAKHVIELLPHKHPRLAICESYRSLRTALLLSSAEELKVVAVTSAEPGEGKTATSCNLGVVFAQLGRRVLLLDADLRKPRMHKLFGVSNRLGLVNYLTGQVDFESLILDTEVPNLSVCPSGPSPPNPSELLASDRMRDLLARLRSRFDFILIDTPPALPVADAVILGTQADGVILCAKAGTLLREDAKLARERFRYNELKILGTVLNRYRTRPGSYNRRYQYYGVYEEERPLSETHSAA